MDDAVKCRSQGVHTMQDDMGVNAEGNMTASGQLYDFKLQLRSPSRWTARLRGLHSEQVNMKLALRNVVKAAVQAAQRGRRVQPHCRLHCDAVEVGKASWNGGRRAVALCAPCRRSSELSRGAVGVSLSLPHMHAATCCRSCATEDQYSRQCAASPCAPSIAQPLPPPCRALCICTLTLCGHHACCCSQTGLLAVS